ncbi:hypothetical protein ACUH90_04355 [Dermabacteraceae bacterium P7054]
MTQEKNHTALVERFEVASYLFSALLLVTASIAKTDNPELKQRALLFIMILTTLSIYKYLIICAETWVKHPRARTLLKHSFPILAIIILIASVIIISIPHRHILSMICVTILALLILPIFFILTIIPLGYTSPFTSAEIPVFGDQRDTCGQLIFLAALTLLLSCIHIALTSSYDSKSRTQVLKAHLVTIAMTALSIFSLSELKLPGAENALPDMAPLTYLPVANTLACCLAILILHFKLKSGLTNNASKKIQDDTTESNQKGSHTQQKPTDTETTEHQISTHNSKSANKTLQGINEIGFTILCILLLLRSLRHPK